MINFSVLLWVVLSLILHMPNNFRLDTGVILYSLILLYFFKEQQTVAPGVELHRIILILQDLLLLSFVRVGSEQNLWHLFGLPLPGLQQTIFVQ